MFYNLWGLTTSIRKLNKLKKSQVTRVLYGYLVHMYLFMD